MKRPPLKRFFLLTGLLFVTTCVQAQNLQLLSGPSFGRYWNKQKAEGHYTERFGKFETGYQIGAEVSQLRLMDSMLNVRLGIVYETYGGSFDVANGGLGSGTNDSGSVRKTNLSFTIFPLNWQPVKNLNVSLGIQQSFLIESKAEGMRHSWGGGITPYFKHIPLSDVAGLVRKRDFAALVQLSYRYNWKNWVIEPRFCTVIGLTNELPGLVANVNHFRIVPSLGIGYSFN